MKCRLGEIQECILQNQKKIMYRNGDSIIDLILRDLLQSVFSVVSAPDNTVQSKLVSLTKTAGF